MYKNGLVCEGQFLKERNLYAEGNTVGFDDRVFAG